LHNRLIVSLLYLKHAFNESDKDLIQRWDETSTWQYFSGNEYIEHRRPCDPTQLVKFRRLPGNLGLDIKHRGKFNSLTDDEKKSLKRRQPIEPIIGHLKADHRMNR
jgi:hypothetical protein